MEAGRQTRRFPRPAIEELAVNGGGGAYVELTEYTASWLAAKAAMPGPQGLGMLAWSPWQAGG